MRRTGFTLVEILIVIAIIGILAGISMPAISYTFSTLRESSCAHHLNQTYTQINAYVGDYKHYPYSVDYYTDPGHKTGVPWYLFLRPYAGQKFDANKLDEMLSETSKLVKEMDSENETVKTSIIPLKNDKVTFRCTEDLGTNAKTSFSVNGYMFPKCDKSGNVLYPDSKLVNKVYTSANGSMYKPEYFVEDHSNVAMLTDAPIEKSGIMHFTDPSDFNKCTYQHGVLNDKRQLVMFADGHIVRMYQGTGNVNLYIHYDNTALQMKIKGETR